MMAETGHTDDNGESSFEFVNVAAHQERSEVLVPENPSSAVSGNISQPNVLPSFANMQQHEEQHHVIPSPPTFPSQTTVTPANDPTHPQIPPPPNSSSSTPASNPFSVRASGSSLTPSVAHHIPPSVPSVPSPISMPLPTPPPVPSQPMTFPSQQPMNFPPAPVDSSTIAKEPTSSFGLEMPFEVSSQPNDPSSPMSSASYQSGAANAGVWGWFNKTISNSDFLTKVAEKAKTSVDNMITTLDPQMKDYMSATGTIELIVVTADVDMITSVKIGFSRWFPQVIIRGVPPMYSSSLAVQPVGFEYGFQAAMEKINNVRQSGQISPNAVVFAESSFLFEVMEKNWCAFHCVVISDTARNVDVYTYSQPVPISSYVVDLIKNQTPSDYAYLQSGFAVNIDQIMAHSHGLTSSSWHEQFGGLSKSDLIRDAAVSASYLYKARI